MKIGVIGAGRLGVCFALLCEQAGYDVLVSDVREDYVKNLRNKIISTTEPEVSKLLSTSPRLSAAKTSYPDLSIRRARQRPNLPAPINPIFIV